MYSRKEMETHLKSHSVREREDDAAVTTLKAFLGFDGRICTNFTHNDKWPNIDGTFEFVSNPNVSRKPEQNFFVQIKGTGSYTEKDGVVKYSLKALGFPAFIYNEVTADPGILFVVLDPESRDEQRVFWKYMSVDFINSIDYTKESVTISFEMSEEIKNTDESIDEFCEKIERIIERHSFIKRLDDFEYSRNDVEKIIIECNDRITESIASFDFYNDTRDNLSKKILRYLGDLCSATLLLNSMYKGYSSPNIQLAWEQALFDRETKYLASFLKGLRYLGNRIPDDGQSERLMLKYYDFLWEIRKLLKDTFGMMILNNLELFPHQNDQVDEKYYSELITEVNKNVIKNNPCGSARYYIHKKTPFFVEDERYFELTLQLAGAYATKYNRLTVYTKENIITDYSIQIGYDEISVNLFDVECQIKFVTDWRVSIDPFCINTLAKILCESTSLSSKYGEYGSLMKFLTNSGMNLLEMIDLSESKWGEIENKIYEDVNTDLTKKLLIRLREEFCEKSDSVGRNVIRYLIVHLREEELTRVMPNEFYRARLCDNLYLSKKCLPFEKNPYISNLAGKKTSNMPVQQIINIAGYEQYQKMRPYLLLKSKIQSTGEMYFNKDILKDAEVSSFNDSLDSWEKQNGYKINSEGELLYIDSYENSTIYILKKLSELSSIKNGGQKEYNQKYLKSSGLTFSDAMKKEALENAFVNSNILLIYGAAGTGKTTLINHISNMMTNHRKLFLTKTHTALQNLQRRIDNPGSDGDFISLDSFTRTVSLPDYDIIFVDECSIIDNRTMATFLSKVKSNTFLVLAGDTHQIESIDFGNWFYYAKDIIKTRGANVELLSTWRTDVERIITLWDSVRNKEDIIEEKLAFPGPFSEDIGKNIFNCEYDDEVVLCLNYDGKFGLNNMNVYFQNANDKGEPVVWQDWVYKIGDKILFNNSERFPILYNNLKGTIVDIQKNDDSIEFTIDVQTIITERDCRMNGITYISNSESETRIGFAVYKYDETKDEKSAGIHRKKTVVPFQLAYAVSIHKAQGLEYDSVKIIIPSANAERITHSIFYTAITRAKKNLKIYWSPETMKSIVKSFSVVTVEARSQEIIKRKLSK